MTTQQGDEVETIVVAAWICERCDVWGRSALDTDIECWYCRGEVLITARPTVKLSEWE